MLPWPSFIGFLYMGAHWRHLANATELSLCSVTVALCQIILTTCYCIIIRLHCISMYVDAAYCNRPSSKVCEPVVIPAKTAETTKMPFGWGQGTVYF